MTTADTTQTASVAAQQSTQSDGTTVAVATTVDTTGTDAPHRTPRPCLADLGSLPAAASERALQRWRLLGDLAEHAHLTAAMLAQRAEQVSVSPRTLRRYHTAYQRAGLAGLAPQPRRDRGTCHTLSQAMIEQVEAIRLATRDSPLHQVLAGACAWAAVHYERPPSYWQVRAICRRLPPPVLAVADGRLGEFRNRYRLTSIQHPPHHMIWQLDHQAPIPVLVRVKHDLPSSGLHTSIRSREPEASRDFARPDERERLDSLERQERGEPGERQVGLERRARRDQRQEPSDASRLGQEREVRPYMTLVMDSASRMVMGAYFRLVPPDRFTVAAALRDALLVRADHPYGGVPHALWVDNGKDLLSAHVRQLVAGLGIDLVPGPPYQPQIRGIVERMHRTLETRLWSTLPGYCGPNIVARHPQAHAVLTLEELMARFRQFLVQYHGEVHTELGMAPQI